MKLTRNTISRMISASLAAMLFLTACGNTTDAGNENTSAEKDSTSDTTTEESMPVLPERDFGGYEFTFLNGNTAYTYGSVVAEEQNGETMNDLTNEDVKGFGKIFGNQNKIYYKVNEKLK